MAMVLAVVLEVAVSFLRQKIFKFRVTLQRWCTVFDFIFIKLHNSARLFVIMNYFLISF